MKKHFLVALFIAPLLAMGGYSLTDWYLKRDRRPPAIVSLQKISASCSPDEGCRLMQGDFVLTVRRSGPNALQFEANQRLKGVMAEVAGVMPPRRLEKRDGPGYRWRLKLDRALPASFTLRLVAAGHWRNYLADVALW